VDLCAACCVLLLLLLNWHHHSTVLTCHLSRSLQLVPLAQQQQHQHLPCQQKEAWKIPWLIAGGWQ
jgi:hypothetical protein